MLGKTVSVRKVGNRVVVTNRPKRQLGKPSEKLEAFQEKFQAAVKYSKRQIAKADARALYATGITAKKRSAFIVALTDYLSAPKVKSISTIDYHGAIGDPIVVKATDDFMVTKVKVMITRADGILIEEGEAQLDAETDLWVYKATAANPVLAGTTIQAMAFDKPGNQGTAQIVL